MSASPFHGWKRRRAREAGAEDFFFAGRWPQLALQLLDESEVDVVLVDHHAVQVDIGDFRRHGIETVAHQGHLQEFKQQLVFWIDRLNRRIVG